MQEKEIYELLNDEAVKKCIAQNLKKNRKKNHMSMDEVGKYVGVSRQSIGMYENTKRFPRVSILLRLATAYDVSLEELIGYNEITEYLSKKADK